MNAFEEFFLSGRLVQAIIVLVICEAAALFVYRWITGRGVDPWRFLPTLLAGLFLLCALLAALSNFGWIVIALCLSAALLAHLADLRLRWTSKQQ